MTRDSCSAVYRAEQRQGAVIVFAEGSHRVPGSIVYLEEMPESRSPRHFLLHWEKHRDPTADTVTPFTVMAMFHAPDRVDLVRVHDADGWHTIEVEHAPGIVFHKAKLHGDCYALRLCGRSRAGTPRSS